MEGFGGLHGLQGLFLLEALPSIILSFFFWYFLPENPETCTFLSPQEKERVITRLKPYNDLDPHQLSLTEIGYSFKNWHTWVFAFTFLCINTPRDILNLFTPAIINQFGFSIIVSNLLTAPLFAVNFIVMLCLGYSSTRTKEHVLHIVITLSIAVVGWVVLATSFNYVGRFPLLVQYFVLLVVLVASSGFVPVFWAWMTQRMKGTTAVVSIGLINSLGNASGLVAPIMTSAIVVGTGSYLWVAGAAAIFGFLGCCGVLWMRVLMKNPEVDYVVEIAK